MSQEVSFSVDEEFDAEKAAAVLEKNKPTKTYRNRPKGAGDIKRYAMDMLRGKWALTGEPIIISTKDHLINGQHRCEAVIQAEKIRAKNPQYWRDNYGWRGPVKVPMCFVFGITERDIDALDTGRVRKAADVLFRKGFFDDATEADGKTKAYGPKAQATLARLLSGAARVAWLRIGGRDVSDAPKFPHTEMVEFVGRHPKLQDIVLAAYEADRGDDSEGSQKLISGLVSLAYVAGIAYLGACVNESRDKYDSTVEPVEPKAKDLKDAKDFVQTLADCVEQEKGSPILALRAAFNSDKQKGETRDRDSILASLVVTYNAFINDETGLTAKDVRVSKTDPRPRLGGLDVEPIEPEPEVEPEPEPEAAVAETNGKAKKPRKAKAKKPVEVEAESVED